MLGRTLPETDVHSLLIAKLQDEDAIVVAHVGGRYADIKYAHDARLEPSVEVHSSWGTFEWILADAFESNYRVGIVASSDGHKGRPGAEYPGDSQFGSYGGLTCHLLPQLDRDHFFQPFVIGGIMRPPGRASLWMSVPPMVTNAGA